jgi:hypothetical protein
MAEKFSAVPSSGYVDLLHRVVGDIRQVSDGSATRLYFLVTLLSIRYRNHLQVLLP